MGANKKTTNITIKWFSIIFAVFLWAYVMGQVNPMVKKSFSKIPIRYDYENQLITNSLELIEPKIAYVEITVNGRRNEILKLKSEDFNANIDLRGYSEGEQKIPIDVDSTLGKEIIIDYSPKHLLAQIDAQIEKQFPINIEFENKLMDDYSIGKLELKPKRILINGPRTLIAKIDRAEVRVDLEGINSDLEESIPVKLLDVNGKELSGFIKDPKVVDVNLKIFKNKRVPVILQMTGDLLENYLLNKIKVEPEFVDIKGEEDIIDSIENIKTENINISSYTQSNVNSVELILPDKIELADDIKFKIKYDISKIIEKTIELSSSEIALINVLDGLQIDTEKSQQVYKIKLRGIETLINNLDIETFNPSIVQENLQEGLNKIKLKLDLSEGISNLDSSKTFDLYLKKIN